MRRLVVPLVGLALVGGTAAASAAPAPTPSPASEAPARSLREQVSEASAEESVVLDQLDAAARRRRQLDSRLSALDHQLPEVQRQAQGAEARLAEAHADFVRTQMDMARAHGGLARARQDVRDEAVSAYLGNPSASAANSVLRSGNVRELAATASYLDSVADARRRVVDHYRQLRDATRGLQVSAEAKKDEAKVR